MTQFRNKYDRVPRSVEIDDVTYTYTSPETVREVFAWDVEVIGASSVEDLYTIAAIYCARYIVAIDPFDFDGDGSTFHDAVVLYLLENSGVIFRLGAAIAHSGDLDTDLIEEIRVAWSRQAGIDPDEKVRSCACPACKGSSQITDLCIWNEISPSARAVASSLSAIKDGLLDAPPYALQLMSTWAGVEAAKFAKDKKDREDKQRRDEYARSRGLAVN